MALGKMLGKVAERFLTGQQATSGPKDGPQLKRQDSAIGMAMKGVSKLKNLRKKKQYFGSEQMG